jgi:hypothetical protein
MHNSFLLNYFKYLDKKDRRELRKAVRSPFFNQKEEVIRLFDCLDKNIDNPKVPLSQAWVFEQVFPDKPFNALVLHHAASSLTQLTRRFLAISEFENTPPQYQLSLTRALRQRQATKMYEHELKEAKTFLEKQPLRNSEFHLQHYMLLLDEYDYKRQNRREGDLPVQELSDNLDNFYLAETLRQACAMKAHQTLSTQLTYQQPFSEAVLAHLDSEKIEQTPSIAAYFYALRAQNEENSDQNDAYTEGSYFEKLKDLLINNRHYFNHEELKSLYILAINYCIKQQNRGKMSFIQEALDLYEVGLANEILLENGSISQYAYRNMALLAMKAGDWKKAEYLLETYKSHLPSLERENFYKYNSAILNFRQGKADKALILLQETQPREPLYNLDARRLLARIYFEKNEKDALESLTNSSRTYLNRQKNIGYQKDMYENFFVFIAKIMKLDPKSKTNKAALKAEITSAELVAEKTWLLSVLA